MADRSNQLIVTDYTDNIRLVGELIDQLDVASGGDLVIEFFPLKYSEAEELGNLLTLIVNSQPAPPSSPSRPTSSSSGPQMSSSVTRFVGGVPSPEQPTPPPQPPSGAPPGAAGAQASAQQIRIWPDKVSNRLIVAAPKAKLPEIRRLIDVSEQLDVLA